jgi:SNF2 family DNA or RNA helicase
VTTEYHAKLFAHELSRRHSVGDAEKLAGALLDAQVDLNPHQVEAALFAFKSPLSKGAILADEVGLGKTIEAGLVLAQKWTEGRRRILIITPANLRKQWSQEIEEKFFLPTRILEALNYNKMLKDGTRQPFEQETLVICSFQFAARHAEDLIVIPWDLVVIDEAHRLRNVYRPDNRIGKALKGALANAAANVGIAAQKKQAQAANLAALEKELAGLLLVKLRHDPKIMPLCNECITSAADKIKLDKDKDAAKTLLDKHADIGLPNSHQQSAR